jgi:hypothetical protein
MMFSPCLSPSPSTWPTMAQAALVRVNARRAASQAPSSATEAAASSSQAHGLAGTPQKWVACAGGTNSHSLGMHF